MTDTARMLELRLALVERVRRVERALARAEHARAAQDLMRGRSHELGNAIQIVQLSALELGRRIANAGTAELVADMQEAADQAAALLAAMIASARGEVRAQPGPAVAPVVRAAVELARAAVAAPLELRVEADESARSLLSEQELEAIVLAAVIDAADAGRISIALRERVIQTRKWIELVRVDDRQLGDGDLAAMFEPHSVLHVVAAAACQGGGAASIAPGRGGLELVVELPASGP